MTVFGLVQLCHWWIQGWILRLEGACPQRRTEARPQRERAQLSLIICSVLGQAGHCPHVASGIGAGRHEETEDREGGRALQSLFQYTGNGICREVSGSHFGGWAPEEQGGPECGCVPECLGRKDLLSWFLDAFFTLFFTSLIFSTFSLWG